MSRSPIVAIVLACLALAAASAALSAPGAEAAGAACAAGPTTVAGVTYGTPCDDRIVVAPGVASVKGGGGDDTIVPAPIPASAPCPAGCHFGVGSQTFEGGPGDDIVFGERGNDILRGGEGNDQLFGGIGDDLLDGGPGNDRLSGGFGADSIDGAAGDDYVHGDGTVDTIIDSGAGGNDTLSYATGVTPGFPNNVAYPDFSTYPGLPAAGGERGVYLNLGTGVGDNGVAPNGGGVDTVEGSDFETVIGTAFADFIVGTSAGQTIYGGGGGDVILGEGGADAIHGGAGGDRCVGTSDCETTSGAVVQREPSKVAVGLMAPGATPFTQLYLVGSDAADLVLATYSAGPPATVTFTLESGSGGAFDASAAQSSGCGAPTATTVTCALSAPLDSILIAGMGGADSVHLAGFPDATTAILAGGAGSDSLTGTEGSEDVLIDGPDAGADVLSGLGGDDALLGNGGADQLLGGDGNDLFLSNSICDGDLIEGAAGRDNASWARFKAPVEARLDIGQAGRPGAGGAAECAGGAFDSLSGIEDLEGTGSDDTMIGDAGPNQLLGHGGADTYHAGAGADSILANSGDADPVIDCGPDLDTALVDHPEYGDAAPIECESVVEADPNSFRTETELAPPPPAPEPTPPPPVVDALAPRTLIGRRPARVLKTRKASRRVVVRFGSSEPGSSFRCRLDGRPAQRCVSPRAYTVRTGRHRIRIFAIDAAGNADPSPALIEFRVFRLGT